MGRVGFPTGRGPWAAGPQMAALLLAGNLGEGEAVRAALRTLPVIFRPQAGPLALVFNR